MERQRRRIDIVSDPEFLAELDTLDLAELRARRALCTELDHELSFYRRLLHGRIDVLEFERRRRRGEEGRTLIEALPAILGDGAPSGGGHPAVTSHDVSAPQLPLRGRRRIDHLLGEDVLTRLDAIGDDELDEFAAALGSEEREVSAQRRTVHEAHDALSAELQRRYRAGLATVDELLHG